jgi:uncharacterized protein YutE (UPF0331/DUF86 family)
MALSYHARVSCEAGRRKPFRRETGPESYDQAAIDALFAASGAEAVASAVRRAARSFSLKNRAHRRIYGALADDELSDTDFLEAYNAGVDLRNAWVHGPATVAADDAESFILAVRDLIVHLEQVLAKAGVPSIDAPLSQVAQAHYRVAYGS